MASEAELAGVLAHEISHVTEKHTIHAIQKNKLVQIGAEESITKNPELWNKLVDVTSDLVMAGFGRGEEMESDRDGLAMADAAGYAPGGLGEFLKRLSERNKSTSGKQGLFASHPEMKERLATLDKEIKARKYASTAVLADRYKANISYTAKPVTEIATVEAGSAGLAGSTTKPAEEPKKKGFGLSTLIKPGGTREEVGRGDRLRRVARSRHGAQRQGRAGEDDGGREGEPGGAGGLQEGREPQVVTDVAFRIAIGAGVLLLALGHPRRERQPPRPPQAPALVLPGARLRRSRRSSLASSALSPDMAARVLSVNQLCLALAIINLIVVTAINPLRADRVPERFPNIVQDTIIIGLFLVVATVVMEEKFLTTSAVGAVVIGFALQDTLGNMFAGLAIQVEKPFRVGHWITRRAVRGPGQRGDVARHQAPHEGGQPRRPAQRLHREGGDRQLLGADRADAARSRRRRELRRAAEPGEGGARSKRSATRRWRWRAPAPDVLVVDFGASAVVYRVRFWINDFARDGAARDEVRSAIYYSLRRHGYEIPFPMQIEIPRPEEPERASERIDRVSRILEPVPLFAPLAREERDELAARAVERLYGQGEKIVRQGDAGGSMFVVHRGRVRVVEASGRELAAFEAGGYFGEMSMLTGQPRSATVEAVEECQVVELTAASLREVALANPEVVTRISAVVAERQADLDRQKAEAAAGRPAIAETHRSLLTRIQEFLRLPNLLGD